MIKRKFLTVLAPTMLMSWSGMAIAQDAAKANEAPAEDSSREIIVTARKKAENILTTPIAITALTSRDVQERGIVSLTDVATFTPGMTVSNNGASRSDRATQQIILRGFTPPGSLAQTASVFIDGVPVTSALAVNNITNPARVEILKGPQSAYFGRQTFAGAVNIVTKDPSMKWGGQVEGLLGTRSNYDASAELTGPIIDGLLAFRAVDRTYAKNGSYKNAAFPDETLGDQRTRTGTLALLFTPTDRLTIKAFGMITRNDDGPSAQGFISAYALNDATGKPILANQSNCTTTANRPYFCGTAPKLANGPSGNTVEDSYITNFLAQGRGRVLSPEDGVDGYGLRSTFEHVHVTASWKLSNAFTLGYLAGYNRDRNSVFGDTDNYYDVTLPNPFGGAGSRPYMDFPFLVEKNITDFSHEGRVNFDFGKFTGVVGASYLEQKFRSSLGGGNGPLGTTVFSAVNGTNQNKTIGAFFGLNYELTSALRVSVDGRWQNDHVYIYTPPSGTNIVGGVFGAGGFFPGNTVLADKSYKNFSPRGIIQYDFAPGQMAYVSYGKGVSPGEFNTQFFVASAGVQAQLLADGYQLAVEPEKIENYELGLKGRLFGNDIRYSIAAYRAYWNNQINKNTVNYIDPANGRVVSVVPAINGGHVRMTGIEAEVNADVTRQFSLSVNGSINDSYILDLKAPTITAFTGVSDFRGKENPNTSKYSASVSGRYGIPLKAFEDAEAFIWASYSFKSGVWSNAANIVRTQGFSLVNLRAGVSKGPARIEAFATNLFDTDRFTTVTDSSVFVGNFGITYQGSALVVGLPQRRTVGLRGSYQF